MKVYTKTGDKGMTTLIGGTMVSKGAEQIEAYGTVDELISFIALLHDQVTNRVHEKNLLTIIDTLMVVSSLLSIGPGKSEVSLPSLKQEDINHLEKEIDRMDETLPALSSFIVPGGHPIVSTAHVCRSVCRRAERMVARLAGNIEIDGIVMIYLNRLSDYLFVLARKIGQELNVKELYWKPQL